ncbi:MAG: hypothetical protein ACLR6I_07775 [Waltera sp.]
MFITPINGKEQGLAFFFVQIKHLLLDVLNIPVLARPWSDTPRREAESFFKISAMLMVDSVAYSMEETGIQTKNSKTPESVRLSYALVWQ